MDAAKIREAERITRLVVPDLGSTPLYIVQPRPDSAFTPGMMLGSVGFFAPKLDETFRDQLVADGSWKGPGVAVVVDVDAIRTIYADDERGAELGIIATTLHEALHWLDSSDRPAQTLADHTAGLARCQARETAPIPGDFFSHQDSFIRLCCHAWWRCCYIVGLFMLPERLSFASAYPRLAAMSSPAQYILALADEMKRLAHLPLRHVLATEPPTAFRELWQRDFRTMLAPALEVQP